MTQLDNLKKQIQELEETCDAARDRIKNEKISFLRRPFQVLCKR